MSSPTPSQVRAVDPYSSYDSNTVNKLTRMVTYGDDGLATSESCNITLDVISTTLVNMSSGLVYKDDMWINITSPHVVNFQDPDHYYNFDTGFDEVGYYYIILAYTYAKQRPAPNAEILILKPSQRVAFVPGNEWIFLKAVHVSWGGLQFEIDGVFDSDPENTSNKREYIKVYAGAETTLPSFSVPRDISRIVFNKEDGDFYFGLESEWSEPLNQGSSAVSIRMNTIGFNIGDLVYITPSNTLAKASASLAETTADGVVTSISVNGRVKLSGQVRVPVQTGSTVLIGDLVYLSQLEPGTIINTKTVPTRQFLGRCNGIYDSTSVNILFVRGEPLIDENAELATYVTSRLNPPNWLFDNGLYYQDVDISTITGTSGVVMVWDSTSNLKIEPESIEFVNSNILRIWMITDQKDIGVMIIGPAISTGLANNHIVIHESLPVGSWISSIGNYYQDVDISDIITETCIINVRDSDTDLVVYPSNIEFLDSTTINIVRIWMPVNTSNLEVTAIGPTSTLHIVSSLTVILPSGSSWIPNSGVYYQDIRIPLFGGDNEIVLSCVDNYTGKVILPHNIQFVSPIVVRVWMNINTVQLNVTIIG